MPITVKRILEVALIIESMPESFESDGQRDKWFMENFGKVTFLEMDAARFLHGQTESLKKLIDTLGKMPKS